MRQLTEHDFETKTGRERIISAISDLDIKVRDLENLVRTCLEKEQRLESELGGSEPNF